MTVHSSSTASRAKRLRDQLLSNEPAILMEAHNGLSAKLAAEAGFEALWGSGLSISAALGVRDNNEASWTQVLEVLEFMADASGLPILLDGDTGYGNFNNVRRLVRKLEQRSVAGVCVEDKLFPKTNSFIDGERQALAEIDEFCGKLRAAKDTQDDARLRRGRAHRGVHRGLGSGRSAAARDGVRGSRRRRDPRAQQAQGQRRDHGVHEAVGQPRSRGDRADQVPDRADRQVRAGRRDQLHLRQSQPAHGGHGVAAQPAHPPRHARSDVDRARDRSGQRGVPPAGRAGAEELRGALPAARRRAPGGQRRRARGVEGRLRRAGQGSPEGDVAPARQADHDLAHRCVPPPGHPPHRVRCVATARTRSTSPTSSTSTTMRTRRPASCVVVRGARVPDRRRA